MRARVRGVAVVSAVAAAVFALAAWNEGFAAPPRAAFGQQPSVPRPQPVAASAATSLEFELPEEFWERKPDGAYRVTGFRVGYFPPRQFGGVIIVDVPRAAVTVNGRLGRVPLDPQRVPAAAPSFVVRLQTVSGSDTSLWSAPSATIRRPAFLTPAAARCTAPARPAQLSLADVQQHPRLAAAVKELLPGDGEAAKVVVAFRRLEDLATAVVVSRGRKIPLADIARTVGGPPRQSVQAAVRRLRPDLPAPVVRQARAEGRRLIEEPSATPSPR